MLVVFLVMSEKFCASLSLKALFPVLLKGAGGKGLGVERAVETGSALVDGLFGNSHLLLSSIASILSSFS